MEQRWREAMANALYGPAGFYVAGGRPAQHFRTSVHAAPAFGAAVLRLIRQVDAALGRPDPLDVVDVGAGQGELLSELARQAEPPLARRLRLTAVELAPRPAGLAPEVRWSTAPPAPVTGVLLATEWLDNVPVDVAEVDPDGTVRYVRVDPADGTETLGTSVTGDDAAWLDRWWPLAGQPPGSRAEIGRTRDDAWAAAVSTLERGLALTVDYGHLADQRPPDATLTGFRAGRQVPAVPDGSCDITAHVAVDSVAAAGQQAATTAAAKATAAARATAMAVTARAGAAAVTAGDAAPVPMTAARAEATAVTAANATAAAMDAATAAAVAAGGPVPMVLTQQAALRGLGVDGTRPPLARAATDPAGYLRALAAASTAAELTEPTGLGGHYWLLQPVGNWQLHLVGNWQLHLAGN